MYNLYDGYYIYAPTYVPKVRTNSDGNALDINGNLIIDNPDSEIAYIKKNEGSPACSGKVNYIYLSTFPRRKSCKFIIWGQNKTKTPDMVDYSRFEGPTGQIRLLN